MVAASIHALRFANACADDAGVAAYTEQKDLATGHALSAFLGERYAATVTELYRAADTLQSHHCIVIALLDGAIVGHVSCIPAHEFAARACASARILGRSGRRVRLGMTITALRRRLTGIALGPWAPGQLYIHSVAVAANARRQGIATQLIEQAVGRARRDGASALTLNARADNKPAVELYANRGFIVAQRRGTNLRLQRTLEDAT